MIDSEYIELKEKMHEFKSKLTSIQTKLNKKIIIFVDELDRCHPMYTIKTLEIIKHFFGIPNIIFVLSVDKKQIENSVRQIFGVNIGEENGYLRKFIDVDFKLPTPSMEQLAYYNYNLQMKGVAYATYSEPDYDKEQKYLSYLISEISKVLNFSARDLEKFFVRLNLTLDILLEKDILFIEPGLVLNALAIVNIEVFDDYVKGNLLEKSKELNKLFPIWKGIFNNSYITNLRNVHRCVSIEKNTVESNVYKLETILKKLEFKTMEQCELYLTNYPEKIKFIHNFNTME